MASPPNYASLEIDLPRIEDPSDFDRADIEFRGVDHSGPSYEVRLFLDNENADESSPLEEASGYIGSFFIFGHGGCFGDVGHCEVPRDRLHPFDRRPPHPLTPHDRLVVVTDAIRRVVAAGQKKLFLTLVPVVVEDDGSERGDPSVLKFDSAALAVYDE